MINRLERPFQQILDRRLQLNTDQGFLQFGIYPKID